MNDDDLHGTVINIAECQALVEFWANWVKSNAGSEAYLLRDSIARLEYWIGLRERMINKPRAKAK